MGLTCNLQAIDSASRARYDELRAQLSDAVISCSEFGTAIRSSSMKDSSVMHNSLSG